MKFLTPMLATMVVIFGCAKGTTWVKPSTGFGEVRRVAVLPFQSNKAGLGEEITNRMTTALLQLDRFKVVDAASRLPKQDRIENDLGDSLPDQGLAVSEQSLAENLDVDAFFSGSIRRYGNWFTGKNMNIDVRMISRSGTILWTCNYKTDWAFTGLGTEGSLASKIVKEVVKRLERSLEIP